MMSMNLHSWQLAHSHQPHANYYLSRNMSDGHNSAFIAHEDPSLFVTDGEYIDGVFVTDVTALFHTNRHLSQPHNHRPRNTIGNQLAPHNNWDPYSYYQFIDHAYVETDDVNQLIVAMQNLDRNFGSRLSGQPFDYRALLDLPGHDDTEVVSHQEENIIMLKTRTHCAEVEVDSEEICAICLCEYVSNETIGTLECGHEYHATCIEQWLLRGKKNCPICRSSVFPSQQHIQS
ncbi:uncharacterized protein LOC129876834 [Solanum dulcamara]|uniref:uncharacterized protein LOC129876834 n=1 Tax=Solanum dulcamara TaxID=45834 RepID=UPI0024852870|nr:uncharacterized protein LOC129876834 [Solanum dulcamara]